MVVDGDDDDDEYSFCVRPSGNLNKDNGGRRRYQSGLVQRSTKGTSELRDQAVVVTLVLWTQHSHLFPRSFPP